jgi:endonuclease/exonuclease/phosphatase family metal-dependent hydrolase
MRTSEQIYHRIRWDRRLDPTRFVVGIDMHAARPKRLAFTSFTPGPDLPWHRVLFFEADEQLVWDRRTGRDVLDESAAGRVRFVRRLTAPFFEARQPFTFSGGCWQPQAATTASSVAWSAPLRLVTWNVLWDRYGSEQLSSATRRPNLVSALQQLDADVIALQEVERPLLELLLAAGWVRARYSLSDSPLGEDVERYGQLLLSRIPLREVAVHPFDAHKGLIAAVLDLPEAQVVATVHLSSDHRQEAERHRQREFAQLVSGLGALDMNVVCLGDFNDEDPQLAARLGWKDAWSQVHGPDDQTPTFDPRRNDLARINSLSGKPKRLDRALLSGSTLESSSAALLGCEPITPGGPFLSDHFGLLVELEPARQAAIERKSEEPAQQALPSVFTALCWLPPASISASIQRIRQQHDPHFERWPAHVNVLFGFVPEVLFEQAEALLSAALCTLEPFPTTLGGVRRFEHRTSTTLWLDPAGAALAHWLQLRQRLAAVFPRCSQGRGAGELYQPHLTLGAVVDGVSTDRYATEWEHALGQQATCVSQLALLSRRGDGPMEVRSTVALGRNQVSIAVPNSNLDRAVRRCLLGAAERPAGQSLSASLLRQLSSELPEHQVEVTGSRRIGCELPDSDLDLLVTPGAPGTLEQLRERLISLAGVSRLRPVIAARVPGFEFRYHVGASGPIEVDLTVASSDGEAGAIAKSACSDADQFGVVLSSPQFHRFVRLARWVKACARAKGLASAPFGGLPGLGWLVLAAETVRRTTLSEPLPLLQAFFAEWAAKDWREAVSLGGGEPSSSQGPITILTPTAPVRSLSEQIDQGGLQIMTDELYAAWLVVESAVDLESALGSLICAPPLHRQHAAWALVKLVTSQPNQHQADDLLGFVRGRMNALLRLLRQSGRLDVRAWPYARESSQGHELLIGLGRNPLSRTELCDLCQDWVAARSGIAIEWHAGPAIDWF